MTIVVHHQDQEIKLHSCRGSGGSGRVGGAENGLVGVRYLRKHASPGWSFPEKPTRLPLGHERESNGIFYDYYIVLLPILEYCTLKTKGS